MAPLHHHSREGEWFYVLDGEITVEIDGHCTNLYAGGSAFAPRGTAHTLKNFTARTARMLVMATPGDFSAGSTVGVIRFFHASRHINTEKEKDFEEKAICYFGSDNRRRHGDHH